MGKRGISHPKNSQNSKKTQGDTSGIKKITLVILPILIVFLAVLVFNCNSTDWSLRILISGPDLLKIYAAKRLGDAKNDEAVPALIDALEDHNFLVKLAAIKALGELGNMSAFEPMAIIIEEAMQDGHINPFEKRLMRTAFHSMIKIIGQNCDPVSDFSDLLPFTSGLSADVYMELFRFVEKQRRSYDPRPCGSDTDPDSITEYKKFITIIQDSFIDALKDENPYVRYIALQYLRLKKDSYPDIAELLDDENDSVRLFAAIIVGDSGGDPAFNALVEFLDHDDPEVRIMSIERLGSMKNDQVMDVLLELLDSSDDVMREVAIYALGKQENRRAIEPLMECLEDPNERIRIAGIKALWALGERSTVLEAVEELLDDDTSVIIVLRSYHSSSHYASFYDGIAYYIESELEERLARRSFLDITKKAYFIDYAEWVMDWILQGGEVDCGGPYDEKSIGTMYILSEGAVITQLYGASAVTLIAPKGVRFTIDRLGHNEIFYWDENGNAQTKGHTGTIVITFDVKFYLEGLNDPRIDKALENCGDDHK